jgi:hypothetical protein
MTRETVASNTPRSRAVSGLLPIFSCRRFLRGANTPAASHVMRFLLNDLECMGH